MIQLVSLGRRGSRGVYGASERRIDRVERATACARQARRSFGAGNGNMGLAAALLLLGVFVVSPPCALGLPTLDFESLNDLDVVDMQFAADGVLFQNAIALTAGISLNEFEFPPHSGSVVVSDDGGPITLSFVSPVSTVGAFFTYRTPISVSAYDPMGGLVGVVAGSFATNLALSGDPGSMPNEFIRLAGLGLIGSLTIQGDPFGGSFTMDDLQFGVQTVPAPSSLSVFGSGLVLLFAVTRRR